MNHSKLELATDAHFFFNVHVKPFIIENKHDKGIFKTLTNIYDWVF